ncbi:hypothetical protein GOV11_01060 [Candidatus Woesearchaeota archaeon]|nr:hypothetical protein [Candidatus Woesearchaeota archaeon]
MKWLVLVLVLFLAACSQSTPTGNVVADEAQVVHVSVQGANYVFSEDSVDSSRPVKLVFDAAKLPGCSRVVTVPQYGAKKMITPEDNEITFEPLGSGPVRVACSMNMYTGELMVR